MKLPVQISYRHMRKSEAVDAFVRRKILRLARIGATIQGCAVVVEAPHRQHRSGNLYHVRVRLTLPGGAVVVARDPEKHHAHEDVLVAVRDAFVAARRKLGERRAGKR
jgi:ribosome-associated translation inhibitor RaiA